MSQAVVVADPDSIVRAWADLDRRKSVLTADREIADATTSLRVLVVELVASGITGEGAELFDACAMLGRAIAERRGSPTLASFTIEHACAAMGTETAAWAGPARAAVAEGFAAALVENVAREAMRTWEFPSCAVRLGEAALAIAAGHPSDDDEVLAAWAARVAKGAALQGVRRAVVSGNDRARAAVVEALAFVGVEVYDGSRT